MALMVRSWFALELRTAVGAGRKVPCEGGKCGLLIFASQRKCNPAVPLQAEQQSCGRADQRELSRQSFCASTGVLETVLLESGFWLRSVVISFAGARRTSNWAWSLPDQFSLFYRNKCSPKAHKNHKYTMEIPNHLVR